MLRYFSALISSLVLFVLIGCGGGDSTLDKSTKNTPQEQTPSTTASVNSAPIVTLSIFKIDKDVAYDGQLTATDADGNTISVDTLCDVVVPVNTAPIATSQTITMFEDATRAITLSGTDENGDTLTYIIVTQPSHGALSGALPNTNYTRSDSFTFKANDGKVDSVPATVSITINAKAEVINGYVLPPEPDSAINDSTLLGG